MSKVKLHLMEINKARGPSPLLYTPQKDELGQYTFKRINKVNLHLMKINEANLFSHIHVYIMNEVIHTSKKSARAISPPIYTSV